MPFRNKKTADQAQADRALLEEARKARARRSREADEERKLAQSPARKARAGYDRNDQVFQYFVEVGKTSRQASDATDVLNAICREGWELVNGSFVFVEKEQVSRDSSPSSARKVAVTGETMGYYLFKRCEANRLDQPPG